MRIYIVGGYNRDTLLGLQPKDRDFVVVGSSPKEMLSLGMTQVGKDFPVFISKEGEEFALARTERKVGIGYNGFDTDWSGVTLEEDLYRRDLSVNAIAIEVDAMPLVFGNTVVFTGDYIDPYNGMEDLQNKILRPVSEHFGDDPLRSLRAARFLAKYPEFTPHATLFEACKECTKEFKHLPKERIWMELVKVFECKQPSRFFDFLYFCLFDKGVKQSDIFVDLYNLMKVKSKNDYHQEADAYVHTMMVVDYASSKFNNPEVVAAALLHDLGKYPCYKEHGNLHGHESTGLPYVDEFCNVYSFPAIYKSLALVTCKQHLKVHNVLGRGDNKPTKPKSIMKLFEDTNALNKTDRFKKMLQACESDAKGRVGTTSEEDYIQADYLLECLEAVRSLDTKSISKEMLGKGKTGVMIGGQIRVERINSIRGVMNKWKNK